MLKHLVTHAFVKEHIDRLNVQILWTTFIFMALGVSWNLIFLWFDLPFSRADIGSLLLILGICIFLMAIRRLVPVYVMKHFVVSFTLFLFIGLYFGSGFSEAWAYFFITPIIAGLYGSTRSLVFYSFASFVVLGVLSVYYPLSSAADGIDISNRLLCHVIMSTFSYLVIKKLQNLYSNQIETVKQSADRLVEQVVKTFVVSVEAKDQYTFGHSERVSKYAVAIAKLLPEYQDEIKQKNLHLMGLLHDIGKINIPEEVLQKPSSLTDEEYELIKTHPVVGAKMIEKIEALENLKSGVLYHHERWDGQGYPTQSRGLETPLDARILALADAFDAMTSSRAYRPGMEPHDAFQILEQESGRQFDPDLISHLASVKWTWSQIYKESFDDLDEFEQVLDLL